MLQTLVSLYRRAVRLLPASRLATASTPLDPLERLRRHGGGLPLMIELSRTGW